MKKNSANKGFTLVEFIVAIAITGILVAFLLLNYFKYIDKAEKTACMNNVLVLKKSVLTEAAFDKSGSSSFAASGDIEHMIADSKCPSGGKYSLDTSGGSVRIICSKHNAGVSVSEVLNLANAMIPTQGYDSNYIRTAWEQVYGSNTTVTYDGSSYVLNLATNTYSRNNKGKSVLLYASETWKDKAGNSNRYAKMVYDGSSGNWYIYNASTKTELYDIGKYNAYGGDPAAFLNMVKTSGNWSVAVNTVNIDLKKIKP